jgi:hypothetical protein
MIDHYAFAIEPSPAKAIPPRLVLGIPDPIQSPPHDPGERRRGQVRMLVQREAAESNRCSGKLLQIPPSAEKPYALGDVAAHLRPPRLPPLGLPAPVRRLTDGGASIHRI